MLKTNAVNITIPEIGNNLSTLDVDFGTPTVAEHGQTVKYNLGTGAIPVQETALRNVSNASCCGMQTHVTSKSTMHGYYNFLVDGFNLGN